MTKEEAIRRLLEIRAEADYSCFDDDERPKYHALSMAIQALQDDWIPVSERLPKVGEYVLASVHDHCADCDVIINKYEEQAFWSEGRITAWQPLPESYRPNCSRPLPKPYRGGDTE